ncbi:MAG: alpha/beta hydrolase [Chthoniobacterales bacterium]
MPIAKVNGIELYYELEGSGKPLVFISGYTNHLNQWALLRPELAKHYQLLLFDNRGVGRSASPDTPYTIDQMAEDTAALIRFLGLEKPHVFARSMGSGIGQTLAVKYPALVDKLVLNNPLIQLSPAVTQAFRWLLTMRNTGLPTDLLFEGAIPWLFSNQFMANPQNIKALATLVKNDPYPQSIIGQTRQLEALVAFNSRAWFREISAPTLVITGEEDLCTPLKDSQDLAAGIPDAQLVVLPKMAHATTVEAPEDLCRFTLDFLQPSTTV